MTIILFVMAFVFCHQYSQSRSKLLQQIQSALAERTLSLNGILARLSNQNEFMRLWTENYLSTASDELPASPLISMMEHREEGDFFYIDHIRPPYQRAEVGTIIVGGNSLSGRDALFNKKLGAALELFAFQYVAHELNPFLAWSYCVFLGGVGNIFPWISSEKIALSFKEPKDASYEIGGGQTRILVSPEKNPKRIGVWTKVYVDKAGKGLMITLASPVYHKDRFEGFVCMDITLDFLSQFALNVDPFERPPLLVNNAGQVLAGAGLKTGLPPIADDILGAVLKTGFEEVIRRSEKSYAFINGCNLLSLPVENADWRVIYLIEEWRIARFLIPGFAIYPVLAFCIALFFVVIHRILKTDYILPSIALIDYIQTEAAGENVPVPTVPNEWADIFHRLYKIFELKTVTANMPGGIFTLIRHSDKQTSLSFVSQWISRLTGISSKNLTHPDYNWLDIIYMDDRQLVAAKTDDSADQLSLLKIECRLAGDEKNPVWISIASQPRLVDEDTVWDGLMLDVTDRKLAQLQLGRSLEEKEVLLREITHRTKNNMQVIHSLLALQSDGISDPKIRAIFKETQNRIISMAKAHQMLYQAKDLTRIDFKAYLYDLSSGLIESYKSTTEKVQLDFQAEQIAVSLDIAVTCGLVVNELISNSLKYAFPANRNGVIRMRLRLLEGEEQLICLCIGDDGIGFPENFDFKRVSSLGVRLITNLVERQLKGTMEVDIHGSPEFRIYFKSI